MVSMNMDGDALRQGLRKFQTRAAMIEAAIDEGEGCLEAVLPLLHDRNESVRWSAIRILTEVGDERAIAPLVGVLERGKSTTDALNALTTISDQDFGADTKAWRAWLLEDPELRSTASDGILSNESLLVAAIEGLPITLSGEGDTYAATVALPDNRSQQIWIDFSKRDADEEPIVQLCTPCGQADAPRYEWALKLNMSIPYGAIALATLDDKQCLAMVDSYLRATVDPEDIAKSLMSLARQGDAIEKALAHEDRY
ncbi:MAG: HEAT repeat domain-containing protein [Lentisphaerae bacterium]|nr:HEAT repeat domain-containing protein [Lentisphaerota bacterium]